MRYKSGLFFTILINIITVALFAPPRVVAQDAGQCGVADNVGYPFADAISGGHYIRYAYDYNRPGWGFHAGEDWFANRGSSLGDPVQAIADGRVTYSSEIGWGVDKGVVIIAHTLPDGSEIYSFYGHMEALNGHEFPEKDSCVQRGDIIGAVGNPSGRPHLHFEIRHILPDFPGYGYTERPPDLEGYENPTRYIVNWRAWLSPAYKWHVTTREGMTTHPALGTDGSIFVATDGYIQKYTPEAVLQYRLELGQNIEATELSASGFGVDLYTTQGELQHYEYNLSNTGILSIGGSFESFTDVGEVIFLRNNGATLRVIDRTYAQRAQYQDVGRPQDVAVTDSLIALATSSRTPEVLFFTPQGLLLDRVQLRSVADLAPAGDGGVFVRSTYALWHVSPQVEWTFVTDDYEVSPQVSILAADGWGSVYLYTGGSNRQFVNLSTGGQVRWQTSLEGVITARPVIAFGGGCGVYLGSSDGQLAAINAATGEVGETLRIYPGDTPGQQAWLAVDANETVYFAAGGREIIALDGRAMLGIPESTPCVNPY